MLIEFDQKKGLMVMGIALGIALFLLLSHQVFLSQSLFPGQWAAAFSDPGGKDLTVEIQNGSPDSRFHWRLLQKDRELASEDIEIASGQTGVFDPLEKIGEELSGKIRVAISDSAGNTREIYKIFP